MSTESLTPRHALPIGAVSLLPLVWYALGSSLFAGLVSVLNVLIILGCLYVAFTPVETDHDDHGTATTA